MQRQTRQFHAVLNAIEHSGRCLHAAEIWALAKRDVSSLNLSTVYRQLKLLHEQRQISRIELPGEPPRFEALCGGRPTNGIGIGIGIGKSDIDGAGDEHAAVHAGQPADHDADHHHHHFHCTGCERVFVLHACPGPLDALLPAGFTLQRHDLTLHGHCGDCVSAGCGP